MNYNDDIYIKPRLEFVVKEKMVYEFRDKYLLASKGRNFLSIFIFIQKLMKLSFKSGWYNTLLFETLHVFVPIIGLAINVSVQIISLRYLAKLTYFKSVIFGFLCGLISILIFDMLFILNVAGLSIDLSVISFINLITYSLFGLCYLYRFFICRHLP